MDRLRNLDDAGLEAQVKRLERDAEDFRQRASLEAASLERAGRYADSDPLHQRLTSIHTFLQSELRRARQELARRTASSRVRRGEPAPPVARALRGARRYFASLRA